jgi:tripartite-type tricarboxylate transporter receptor subunit TctC
MHHIVNRIGRGLTLAVAAGGILAGAQASAQGAKEFYAGKNIQLIISSGAGGGFDIYSRTLARSLPNHIPGHPNMVIQNMPGATGIVAANHLYNVAAKDGTVIGALSNSNLLEPLYGNKNTKYDVLKFNWLGSIGRQRAICVTWHTSPIKSWTDAKARIVNVSATAATSNNSTLPRLLNNLIGTQFKVVIGYSTSGMRLAMERGEVEGICGLSYQTLIASAPQWFENKQLNIIGQIGLGDSPVLPNVPNAINLVSDKLDREALELLVTPQEAGRPHVAPPGLPADRLGTLRAAFDATMADPDFLAEAKKTRMVVEPMTGEEMLVLLTKAHATPKPVVTRTVEMIAGGDDLRAPGGK